MQNIYKKNIENLNPYIPREGLKISEIFQTTPPRKKTMNYWLRKRMKSRKILKYLFWQKIFFEQTIIVLKYFEKLFKNAK